MGEEIDPLTTGVNPAIITNRGIVIVMFALIVLGTVVGFVIGGTPVGVGFLTGGILSAINYFWLERSTRALFEQRAVGSTMLLAAKYILRYAAIGGVLLLIYMTDALPMVPVIAGLSTFAIAVVFQGIKNIFVSTF